MKSLLNLYFKEWQTMMERAKLNLKPEEFQRLEDKMMLEVTLRRDREYRSNR